MADTASCPRRGSVATASCLALVFTLLTVISPASAWGQAGVLDPNATTVVIGSTNHAAYVPGTPFYADGIPRATITISTFDMEDNPMDNVFVAISEANGNQVTFENEDWGRATVAV